MSSSGSPIIVAKLIPQNDKAKNAFDAAWHDPSLEWNRTNLRYDPDGRLLAQRMAGASLVDDYTSRHFEDPVRYYNLEFHEDYNPELGWIVGGLGRHSSSRVIDLLKVIVHQGEANLQPCVKLCFHTV